jgi:folate-binding protein YgfZ
MNSAWIEFLASQGANVPQALNEAALTGNLMTDLSNLAVINVSGADAEKFLQGQFTNDVKQLTASKAQRSAWCSAKGRVLSSFYLAKTPAGNYSLILPQDAVETLLKRLRMFVLRADVKFSIAEDCALLGVMGEGSAALLQAVLGSEIATQALSYSSTEEWQVLCTHESPLRYLVYGKVEVLQKLWLQAVAQQFIPSASSAWELLDILSGIPQIKPELSDEFIPQMLNWEVLEGMSFKKGCYAGQEIIARTQYLGALKRRLFLVKFASTQLPALGENILVPEDTQSVGKVVNVQLHPAGYALGLAVLQLSHAEATNLKLSDGTAVECLPLPYTVVTQ